MRSAKLAPFGICICLIVYPAYSAEPSGCDKFAWPLAKEQELLRQAQPAPVGGTNLDRNAQRPVSLKLASAAEARLPAPPERAPKNASSFAGLLEFAAARKGGVYKISLSEGAWIDVFQGRRFLKPLAFTGATDCPNIRKSVKFDIGPDPFTIQLSDAPLDNLALVVTPAE